MSSSMQNGWYKMFPTLTIVLVLFPTIETDNPKYLMELPLQVPAGSSIIHATLTDVLQGKTYHLQEYISAPGSAVRGKIVVSDENDSYTIHYAASYAGVDSKERLVIHGTNCLLFTYKNSWDQTLPGIKKPLLNFLLLMGPSILYRLDFSMFYEKTVADKNIRGIMMKGATTEIDEKLGINYYYKKLDFVGKIVVVNPSRIEFKENLVLDIYLKKEDYPDQLQNQVQPLPGIGCPHYFFHSKTMPVLKTDYLHFNVYEYIEGSINQRTVSEIYASGLNDLLGLKATLLGVTTETIIDYRLGVSFQIEQGGYCHLSSVGLNAPGINSLGYFSLNNLLLIDLSSKYLGQLKLEHRSGLPVEAWETVKYNFSINGKNFEKAVITQYFAESHDDIFYDKTLVSTTIAIYKFDLSKNNYIFVHKIIRDYMNFETAGSEAELHDSFTIRGCRYLSSGKTLTLKFKLACQANVKTFCNKFTESHVYKLKEDFTYYVILTQKITPLRISDIQFRVIDDNAEVEATFVDTPHFRDEFSSKSMSISSETFKKMPIIKTSNVNECLDKLSQFENSIDVVIYRPSDSACGYLNDLKDLKEDNRHGQICIVYQFPLHNFHRMEQELHLDQLHDAFLKQVGKVFLLSHGDYSVPYKVIDVIAITQDESISNGQVLTSKIRADSKLKVDGRLTVSVPDARTFADCYRACRGSEQLSCNTFSFCQTDDSIDCRVSNLTIVDAVDESHRDSDQKCSIFSLNILNDYSEVRNRKFKSQVSSAMQRDITTCAEACHASPDCSSFQYCDYSCSFGGLYTDSSTEYDERCRLYFPKVTEKYQKTGNKIVSEVMHTEMNLTLDQCAALCHGWLDSDNGCASFNYCPKSRTESSCSLTKFSGKSSDTKTNDAGDCSNYELKKEANGQKSRESSSSELIEEISGSSAFGIIVLFLIAGALLGFFVPIAYSKIKSTPNGSQNKESFNWTRQVDDQPDNL